jgi:hypothetical protein
VLDRHAASIRSATPSSEHDAQNKRLCLDAIEAFRRLAGAVDLGGFLPRFGEPNPPKLTLEGTAVCVRPALTLSGVDERGHPAVGAIKLCFSKRAPMKREAAQYVAALLHYHLEVIGGRGDARGAPERCLVNDVFPGEIVVAPQAFKQRRADIHAACEEIAVRWPSA